MSGVGIEHRAAKVSSVTGFSTILSVVFQIISVPICLKYWGQDAYGSWLVLFSAFLLLRALDGGYVAYVGNKLNYLYHQDIASLREHLSSAVVGVAVIGALQLFLAAGTLVSGQLADMLSMPAGAVDDRLGLLVLIASWALTGSYIGLVHRLLIPAGLMYQAAWWFMVFQVSQFAAVMAAALLRLDMLQSSLLFAFSQLAIYMASAVYVRCKLPAYYPWLQGWRVSTGLKDLRQSLLMTVSNLIQQGATNGVVLLVSALAGPAAVPAFITVRTMANLWTNVTNVLTTPLLADVVRFHAKGEPNKLLAVSEAYWVLVGSVVNLGVLLAYPLLPLLYGYWTGHIVSLDTALLCLLLAGVVVTNAGALMAMHLNGINSLRIVLGASVMRGLLFLGGGALGYGRFGLAGFGLGILTGELVALFMMGRFFVQHELTGKGVRFSAAAFAPVTLSTGSVLFFLLAEGIGRLPTLWTWSLALSGVMTASVWGWKRLSLDVRIRLLTLSKLFQTHAD